MKITAFLLLAICLHVSATSLAQNVTLSEHKASLEKVFKDIRQQSGFNFFYNKDWMREAQPVDLNVHNMPLAEALKICFADQPFTYEVVDKTIVLKLKEALTASPNVQPAAQPVTITGKVTDELGNPMAGVTVKQKDNPNNGVLTNAKGNYSISVPDNSAVLEFSYVGYETQELQAKDVPQGSVIILKPAENNLKEVVISKGYYDEKQLLSTGDVSVVGAKTIEQQPVSDPIQALIGRVAGLDIQQTSGIPGAYATIHIRGLNSIANGNDPFYVIDGVPFNSTSLTDPYYGGGALGNPNTSVLGGNGQGLSPFNILNPDDIESIEVLKDADATAIYGSRGANGVILITTKKGKAGETKVNVDLSQGIGQVPHFLDLMNTQQYLQMRHQAYANDGLAFPSILTNPKDNHYDVNGLWDTTRYTNWQKVLIGNTAHYTNAQGSISGGNANTQFLIGGGYYRSTTVFPGDYSDQKGSLHFNLTHTSSNQRFHVLLTASYGNEVNDVPQADFTSSITLLAPDAPPLYNPDGMLNWAMHNGTATFTNNPLASTLISYTATTNNLVSNMDLSYQLLPGLTLESNFGYNHDELNFVDLIPSASIRPPYNTNPNQRYNYLGGNLAQGWIIEPKLSYYKRIGKGDLHILFGGTLQQSSGQYTSNSSSGFASDALINDPLAGSTHVLGGYGTSEYRYDALLARIGYTWDDKYLLNLTANRDGSTRFGSGRQFGNFGSVGVGWVFSKEKGVQDALPWLSTGKLRASYGTTGSDQIGNYQYLSVYNINAATYQGLTSLSPGGLANPYLEWEVDKKLEGGLDLGFSKDRINLSLSYYRNRTGNQLVVYPLPQVTGFQGIEYNLPAVVQNTGIEAELHTINFQAKDFNWSTSVNFTLPENKLVSYPGIANTAYSTQYVVGKSLFIRELYQYTGVNPQTGLYTFAQQDASGNIPYPQGLVTTAPITQKYYGGIGNTFNYKGFSLDVFIQFTKQLGYGFLNYFSSFPGAVNHNLPKEYLSAWQTPGQSATLQRVGTSFGSVGTPISYFQQSTGTLTDASYIRLGNVALSYKLPVQWQSWAHNARIYLNGQNLYTFTHYMGLDPETGSAGLPPLRVIMMGICASF